MLAILYSLITVPSNFATMPIPKDELCGPGSTSGYRAMPTKIKLQISTNLLTSKTSKTVINSYSFLNIVGIVVSSRSDRRAKENGHTQSSSEFWPPHAERNETYIKQQPLKYYFHSILSDLSSLPSIALIFFLPVQLLLPFFSSCHLLVIDYTYQEPRDCTLLQSSLFQ